MGMIGAGLGLPPRVPASAADPEPTHGCKTCAWAGCPHPRLPVSQLTLNVADAHGALPASKWGLIFFKLKYQACQAM